MQRTVNLTDKVSGILPNLARKAGSHETLMREIEAAVFDSSPEQRTPVERQRNDTRGQGRTGNGRGRVQHERRESPTGSGWFVIVETRSGLNRVLHVGRERPREVASEG